MSLSPELQGYAENIWRRFPEEFISLGSPHLKEFFELREDGIGRHRVIDTKSERVIEIILPRRQHPLGLLTEAALEEADGDPLEAFDSEGGDQEQLPQPPLMPLLQQRKCVPEAGVDLQEQELHDEALESAAALADQIFDELERLNRTIDSFEQTLPEYISQEVQSQLRASPEELSLPSSRPPVAAAPRAPAVALLPRPQPGLGAAPAPPQSRLLKRRGKSLTPIFTASKVSHFVRRKDKDKACARASDSSAGCCLRSTRGEGESGGMAASAHLGPAPDEAFASESPGALIQSLAERRRRWAARSPLSAPYSGLPVAVAA